MSASNPIRVMLVDDHDMVRRGLAAILRIKGDLQLVAEASNGQEAVQACEAAQPDVILMDLVMPEMDGATATQIIRKRWPAVQVIALTSFTEKDLVQGVLEAGAIGFLLKNVSSDELADAIRQAHAGQRTLAPEAAQVLIQAEKLERLARAVIDAPPDASTLPELLAEHVPGMFRDSRIEVRIFPRAILLRHPAGRLSVPAPVWAWLRAAPGAICFPPGAPLPWGGQQPEGEGLLVSPVVEPEGKEALGGIYIAHRRRPEAVADLLPMLKSLAAQVSSALQTAKAHRHAQTQQRVAQELALAGQIQASFLPGDLPAVPGWQLAATLEPARETSGDFYDFFTLRGGRLGIVIADTADKGMGAALYMALCRTLIRTYAAEHQSQPHRVLSATNRRILSDARAGLFITLFYGILDPGSGTLTYSSAGHHPPYILRAQGEGAVQPLHRTGMALGVIENESWEQRSVQLGPGDLLLLYTDGVPEAQNGQGQFFGWERMLETALKYLAPLEPLESLAQHVHDALFAEVRRFMGDTPQFDDMTLLVLARAGDEGRTTAEESGPPLKY